MGQCVGRHRQRVFRLVMLLALIFQGCGGDEETVNVMTSLEPTVARAVGATANPSADVSSTTDAPITTESTAAPSTTTTSTSTTTAAAAAAAVPTTLSTTTTAAPSSTASPSTAEPDLDAATAYLRRCGGCHGAEGTEQGATSLSGVGSLPGSYVLDKVVAGGGGMPAFGEWLDQDEIDVIVAYVRANF